MDDQLQIFYTLTLMVINYNTNKTNTYLFLDEMYSHVLLV